MDVKSRIYESKLPAAFDFKPDDMPMRSLLDFDADELKVYRGAGWALARFEAGRLVELLSPSGADWPEMALGSLSDQDARARAETPYEAAVIRHVATWVERHVRQPDTEIWFGMCSSTQFCAPEPLFAGDLQMLKRAALSMANMSLEP